MKPCWPRRLRQSCCAPAGARGHHGGARGRGLPDRLGPVGGQGGAPDRHDARRVQAAGGATCTRFRDRPRAAGARVREIGAKLRLRAAQGRDEAQATVRRVTGKLAGLAERPPRTRTSCWPTPAEPCTAPNVPRPNAGLRTTPDPSAGRRRGRLRRAVDDLCYVEIAKNDPGPRRATLSSVSRRSNLDQHRPGKAGSGCQRRPVHPALSKPCPEQKLR